ncbi:MAG TPA: helix-turn-helix domain-containing protein [Acidimicrobiales bacterium]|nr:helix-turn-helix domain-containing protein [Acidimicrobiales bacterium]
MTVAVAHPLLAALAPVATALGATLVEAGDLEPGDVPLEWDGQVVGGLRVAGLHGALGRLLDQAEREMGAPLAELDREDKQEVVRRLDEQGAFTIRRAVEEVADVLGVSRFTIYNYLNASDRPEDRA